MTSAMRLSAIAGPQPSNKAKKTRTIICRITPTPLSSPMLRIVFRIVEVAIGFHILDALPPPHRLRARQRTGAVFRLGLTGPLDELKPDLVSVGRRILS